MQIFPSAFKSPFFFFSFFLEKVIHNWIVLSFPSYTEKKVLISYCLFQMWGLKCWKVTFVFSSIAVIKFNSFYLHLLCSWFYQIKLIFLNSPWQIVKTVMIYTSKVKGQNLLSFLLNSDFSKNYNLQFLF